MIAKAEKALAAAEAALDAVRRAGEEALKASDYDAAMQAACAVIAANGASWPLGSMSNSQGDR